jgi:hypothetical protein
MYRSFIPSSLPLDAKSFSGIFPAARCGNDSTNATSFVKNFDRWRLPRPNLLPVKNRKIRARGEERASRFEEF